MENKIGRPKNKKNRSQQVVAAFDKDTYEFINFFKNPLQAAKILFENISRANCIRRCADYKSKYVINYIFEWSDTDELTSNTIQEIKEKLVNRPNLPTFKLYKQKNSYRINIPITIIKKLNLHNGDEMKIYVADNHIIIRKS